MQTVRRWICGCLAAILLLGGSVTAEAGVTPLFSIADIPAGTTIDFEQPGLTANDILPTFDMLAAPDVPITTLTFPVTGNSAAPISDRALFGAGFRITTTGLPWNAIGLTGIGEILGQDRTLELTAFDINGTELGSLTRLFAPADSSFAAFNAAAVFLGLASTTPIESIVLTSDNPNTAWDNLRFSPVPEPSTLLLLAAALVGFAAWRRTAKTAIQLIRVFPTQSVSSYSAMHWSTSATIWSIVPLRRAPVRAWMRMSSWLPA